jgi:hypothetical protein
MIDRAASDQLNERTRLILLARLYILRIPREL